MGPGAYDYDSTPVGYYDRVFARRRGVQSKWHHLKFARVRDALGAGGVHLDIGCGPGTFIGTLERTTLSIGADIAQAQLVYAHGHYAGAGRQFLRIAPGGLPFADEAFDRVSLVELVEHLDDAAVSQLLGEAFRVLKPHGRIVLTTPNYRSAWPLVEYLLNRLGEVDYRRQHINRFDRQRLRSALQRAGFAAITLEAYQFAAPFAAALGWRFADLVARLEPAPLTRRIGMLLIATAAKA